MKYLYTFIFLFTTQGFADASFQGCIETKIGTLDSIFSCPNADIIVHYGKAFNEQKDESKVSITKIIEKKAPILKIKSN